MPTTTDAAVHTTALPATFVSLVLVNASTGECTTAQHKALEWYLAGADVRVMGYTTYEWTGDAVTEVWH